jgi:hypothetical protein
VLCGGKREEKNSCRSCEKDLGVLAFWGKLEVPQETSGKLKLEGGNCLDHSQQPSIVLKNRHKIHMCSPKKKNRDDVA